MSDGLQIVISADVQEVQTNLKKAEQSVNQFANTTKKAIPSASAAVTNLNRVVQDAPFGFIAIQNNITELISSFGSLSATSGGAGAALKSIGSALIGPAGLFLAFSAVTAGVTALTQKYGSLGNAIEALTTGNGKLIQQQNEIKKFQEGLSTTLSKEVSQVFILVEAYKAWEGQSNKQKAVLDKLSQTSDIFKKSIDGQVVSYDNLVKANEAYLKSLLGRIIIETQQEQIRQLAKQYVDELIKLQQQEEKNAKAAQVRQNATKNEIALIERLGKAQQNLSGDLIGSAPKVNKSLLTTEEAINQLVQRFLGAANGITSGSGKIISKLGLIDLGLKSIKDEAVIPQLSRNFETLSGVFDRTNLSAKNLKVAVDGIVPKAGQASIITFGQAANKAFLDLANIVTNNLQNVINPLVDSLFSAFANGQNILKSFGNALKNVLAQIAATLIKTAILAAIITALSGGTGGIATGLGKAGFGGSFGGNFLKLFGFGGAAAPTIGNAGGLTGGLQLGGQVVFVQRGYDLVGVLNAANGSIRNIG